MPAHFEIVTTPPPTVPYSGDHVEDTYHWRLRAINGEILCSSETYTEKQNALRGIAAAFYAVFEASGQKLPDDFDPSPYIEYVDAE